jgi:integrase
VPHVDYQIVSGKPYWYYRRRGEKRGPALPPPGTPEFLAAWTAADKAASGQAEVALGSSRTRPGSVSAAVVAYYGSNAWTKELADSSRAPRRRILEKFREEHGDKHLALLQLKHIQAIIAPFSPVVQGNWMRALRGLMKFAVKAQLLASDPTAGVVRDKAERSDGHTAWTEEDVEKYRKVHPLGTRQRLAMELMLNLAVRRSDACRIGPADIKDGWLSDFMPQKTSRTTGQRISIPIRPELAAAIKAMKVVSTDTYLVTEAGKPFATSGSFGEWMRKACRRAGLTEVSSHGLRKLAMIRLAYAGCNTPQIMAISGHRSFAEVQRYVEQANRMRLAEQAMAALDAPKTRTKTSQK